MPRVLMRHHHERHPVAGRHVVEELFHGFQPAGRGTDPDDEKTRRWSGCGIHKLPLEILVLGACARQSLFFQASFVPRPQNLLLDITETAVSRIRRPRLKG